MRPTFTNVLIAVFAVLLGVSGARAAFEGWRLVRGPRAVVGAEASSRPLPPFPVRTSSGQPDQPEFVRLDTAKVVLVLLYDPSCGPCSLNMSNWVDLLAAARGRIDAFALSLSGRDSLHAYWGPLAEHVTTAEADSATLVDAGLLTTPATLLIRNGQVEYEYLGVLNERAFRKVVALLPSNMEGS